METTQNTFEGGLILDTNIATTPKNTLSNALNATISTFNGNELILQNDMGNVKIPYDEGLYACLEEGFVPIGVKVFGNIMYIISYNSRTHQSQIGSFPSPNWDEDSGTLIYRYSPLYVGLKTDQNKDYALTVDLGINDDAFFGFDLKHPVEILAERSYDGSVNLIFTDNKNMPRLINTGFQAREDNTYKIINRIGKNSVHTNRYNITDSQAFDLLTSLYRNSNKIPKIEFNGLLSGGQLMVGSYVIYIIACDKDGNESDILCESGVIPVFLGTNGDPFSVNGGSENLRSDKSISITVSNIDEAYHYLKICYTRSSSANNQSFSTLAHKVLTLYSVSGDTTTITLTGYEDAVDMATTDLNLWYFNADQVKTLCITLNILFLGNVSETYKNDDEYEQLRKISLSVYPMIDDSMSINIDSSYSFDPSIEEKDRHSYYDSEFCYNYTGYHIGEIYRFGIVYIRKDNSLTSVFDVLGIKELSKNKTVNNYILDYVKSLELDYDQFWLSNDGTHDYNARGVSRIVLDESWNLMTVIGIKFNIDGLNNDYINSQYKGYFFVRLKRIPTLLALAYTTNVCEEAYVPSINVKEQGDNGASRYLYESFLSSAFKSLGDGNYNEFYPKRVSSAKEGNFKPTIFNNYKSRLFTLTDYTRFYRDKISTGHNTAYFAFLREYGTNAKLLEWYLRDGYREWAQDNYLAIFASNYADRFAKNRQHYWAYMMFGTAVDSVPSGYNHIHLLNTTSDSSYDAYRRPYYPNLIEAGGCADEYQYGNEQASTEDMRLSLYTDVWISSPEPYDGATWQILYPIFKHNYNLHPICYYVKYKGVIYRVDAEANIYNVDEISNVTSLQSNVFHDCLYRNYTGKNNKILDNRGTGKGCSYIRYINEEEGINDSGIKVYNDYTDFSTWDGKYDYPQDDEEDKYSYPYHPMEFNSYAAFCPEYELNKGHYNNFFTGGSLVTKFATKKEKLQLDVQSERSYIYNNKQLVTEDLYYKTNILGVDEDISLCSINLSNNNNVLTKDYYIEHTDAVYFSSKCGNEHDFSFRFAGAKFLAYVYPEESEYFTAKQINNTNYALRHQEPFNVLRCKYSPYIGCYPVTKDKLAVENFADRIVNIYIPEYDVNNMDLYFELRFNDKTEYQAISDRVELGSENTTCYRGDCFVGWFTHRVNRNFNDSAAPYNDEILDPTCVEHLFNTNVFKVPYRRLEASAVNDVNGSATTDTKAAKEVLQLNIGDLNAVQIGSWVTFPIRSSVNISIRSTDESWTDEKHRSGNSRSFYPLHSIDVSGSYKIPESDNYNSAFSKSGSDKQYWNLNNTIYDNSYYKNRITYSDIHVNGAFENGNRVFLSTHFRDYTDQYGAIVKLLTISGDLIAVCEHGILYIPVKERVQAGNSSTGLVFINSPNVLPEVPGIISDTYGSTWPESIILTPYGIYGVDAVAKKIWYTNGLIGSFALLSDFRILSFLNKALSMWNKELDLNTTNIKSHYNGFKNDVMFTAYDYNHYDSVGLDPNEYVAWNVSFNINSAHSGNGWQTFYSWIPSYSGNIGNNFITFNHVTDRNIILTNNNEIEIPHLEEYNTYLWKHGLSDFVPNMDRILPTNWYGELHPFEFEFVINSDPVNHKIFNNLRMVANKAEPESFHYEVIGECYDLDHIKYAPGSSRDQLSDKPNMYYRQELTKAFYQLCMGSDIKYHKDFTEIVPKEVFKSTMFPLYYSRKGNYNHIYDSYQALTCDGYEYLNLSGGEIIYDLLLDEFKICNHVLGVDIKKNGRLRGNMHYKEDGWYILIPSINYVLKNEYLNSHLDDNNPKLKLALGNNPVPEDIAEFNNTANLDKLNERLGLNYTVSDVTFDKWNAGRHEMRIKDKYLRIKVRYSGKDLAVISGILTLYTKSYS